jgi:hypothetical protein
MNDSAIFVIGFLVFGIAIASSMILTIVGSVEPNKPPTLTEDRMVETKTGA